jgi:2-amino-4-hydroxy-6-hydroxymethyldihydropteridine diphosphokinase
VIALGSNVGNRLHHLQQAVDGLRLEVDLVGASDVYETAPMYVLDQPAFLNAAVIATTTKGPIPLLRCLKKIEADIGRRSRIVNGPREVDLDLITFGNIAYRFEEERTTILRIPHPKLAERRFVLAPVADLAENLLIPGIGCVVDLLEKTNDQSDNVVRIKDAVLHI